VHAFAGWLYFEVQSVHTQVALRLTQSHTAIMSPRRARRERSFNLISGARCRNVILEGAAH
jgi:hypothetical protein